MIKFCPDLETKLKLKLEYQYSEISIYAFYSIAFDFESVTRLQFNIQY